MTDPRQPEPDPLDVALAELDQHLANATHVGRLLATEWRATVEAGAPPMAAAVIIGTRWQAGS